MTNSLPLVSVVVPVYNHERYVQEALDSIFNQTYPFLEIIIIDDGSKDQSINTIGKWLAKNTPSPTRQITFSKQANSGAHATINKGLSIAKGDYLTVLNSDDAFHYQRVEKLINRLEIEKAQFIFSAIKGIDENSGPLAFGHPWRNSYEYSLHSVSNMPTIGFELLRGNLTISTGNLFFSKQLYSQVGEFKNLKLTHDYDFVMRALLITEPVFLNEQLYFYRVHSNNTYSQISHLLESELNEIYREYLVTASKQPPSNVIAPCHWYWPHAFASARAKLKMDNSLSFYYMAESNKVKTPTELKNNKLPTEKILKEKKISLVTHDLSLSGAPAVVVELARSLKDKGYKVKVVSLFDGPMQKELEKQHIPVYILPKFIGRGLLGKGFRENFFLIQICCFLGSLILLFKLNRRAIFNTGLTGRLLIPLSFLNPFYRFIWYIHDYSSPSATVGFFRLKGKMKRIIDFIIAKPNFKLWFGSNNAREIWKLSGLEGKTMYWSGILATPSQNLIDSSKNAITEILSVGTSCPRKGSHELIDAFIMGVQKNLIKDDVKLTIIGFQEYVNAPHDYVGDLILKIINAGLKDRICLISCLQPEQLDNYYLKSDLYVQSSIAECLPIALLKAMSIGLPIITTDVNGCVEAIKNNENGYVCYSRNSNILLETIMKALNNPEKSYKMGIQAKKTFNDKFCLEKNSENIFEDLKMI